MQRLDDELAAKKAELERVDLALGAKTCQLLRDDKIAATSSTTSQQSSPSMGRVPPLELRAIRAATPDGSPRKTRAFTPRRTLSFRNSQQDAEVVTEGEDVAMKTRDTRRVEDLEQALAMMAKEKAILHAELEAQRFEKLRMQKHVMHTSPRYVIDPAALKDGEGESSALSESSAYFKLKHEIERLKGEVRSGYRFVTGLPSATSRSNSNSAGSPSAPCSARTGNTYTPRTPRSSKTCTPRGLVHGKDSRRMVSRATSPLDPPRSPALDPEPQAAPAVDVMVAWAF
jgi:hypothetical protein